MSTPQQQILFLGNKEKQVIVFSTFSQNTELPRLKTSYFQWCPVSMYYRITGNLLGRFISLCQGKGKFLKILIKKHSNIHKRVREENIPGISIEMYSLKVNVLLLSQWLQLRQDCSCDQKNER